ncbi:MAG: hypothetical protein U9P38_05550 [Campylobacterota bacterium]|nr:hypothetical protein [Campylobacterota bacterium]
MKSQIDILHEETTLLLSELYNISTQKGIHLDNDLETGLFMLLVDDNSHEMSLLKHRIERAIKQIEEGTFKVSNLESQELLEIVA